ncbi:uncharacterized protein LOC125660927 isoform X3 [Ostrea edulis]|nr:uncharacterized protein LOC125660927 isoform X3 [Ostrea edulis]
MATPDVTKENETSEDDLSYLSVKKESKIEQYNKKRITSHGPSRIIVILKWLTTLIFAAVLLSCLVTSKLTVIGLSRHLGNGTDAKYQAFIMCLVILFAPNVISIFRSIWNIIGRSDIPWPNKKSILLVILSATFESGGLCIVVLKALTSGQTASGVSAMQIGFVLPILFYLQKGNSDLKLFRGLSALSLLLALVGVAMVILNHVKSSSGDSWSLVGFMLIFISWFPYLNKQVLPRVSDTGQTQVAQPGSNFQMSRSINRTNSSQSFQNMSSGSGFNSYSSIPNNNGANMHVEPDSNSGVPCYKSSTWKVLLISAFTKIVVIFAVSALLLRYEMSDMSFEDAWTSGWDWNLNDDICILFIAHVSTSVVAYVTAVFACHTCMDSGAFVIPLLLCSPLSCILLVVSTSCDWIKDISGSTSDFCDTSNSIYSVVAMVCFVVAVSLTFGRQLWNVKRIVLLKETQLFWYPTYNSVMLEQWLLVNRKLDIDVTEDTQETSPRKEEKTRVYICTTMYRESRKEMQQLLESIGQISRANSDTSQLHFESHVFLDGAVKGDEMSDFALQLVSLLKDALHIDNLLTCTKTATPYGQKLGWKLPGPSEMTFTIHLKDSKKVKKKKRWSQIMYMSYVLDFLSKQHVDRDGNPTVKESDCFILTTDADVKFSPESVEALLDLMKRDTSVGAVCARTYPLGEGPLVWYQKFEYAIGHWFQKAAEHVLGSVLCAPGCFSVYRCSALKDIVPTYASNVERAFDFLIKDMGEDRWLCTLMVQSGWRIEYCAASENETYCPEEFEEFYKQRRRWIASTLANIISLIKDWTLVRTLNHRVSYLFCIYQIFLLTSTFIGPSTVVIIVAGGLNYAWNFDLTWAVILQFVTCVIYAVICLFKNEKWQMQSGKIITFFYAVIMTAVVVGIAEQVSEDFIGINAKVKVETKNNVTVTITPTPIPGAISEDFPVSFVTLYLGLLIAIFLVTGMLHPSDFKCLLNGIVYLLCLPSGYLVLNIYSVVNITDRSWGTREEKEHNTVKEQKPWYDGLETVMRKIFFCFDKTEPLPTPSVPEAKEVLRRPRRESQTEAQPQQRLSQTIAPGFKFQGSIRKSRRVDDQLREGKVEELEDSPEEEETESEEDFDEENPISVREWLPKGMKEYANIFMDNGYENTNFLGMLTEKDLKRLGIKKVAHRRNLLRKIQDIPEFKIPIDVPKDVTSWLVTIGLEEYKTNFKKNDIKTIKDMETLKSFKDQEIREELNITKPGHVQRLLDAINCLRNPTQEERIITEIKEQISRSHQHELKSVNQEEYKFWSDLIRACLEPGSDAFGFEEILKTKLASLRNEWLMVSGIVNCLWIVIIMTLSSSIDLQVAGTNPLSLVFLVVFGFLFVLQFLCMLVHRFTTLSHFIARAPYRFGQSYRTSISFLSRDLDPDEEHLVAEARSLEPQFLQRMQKKSKVVKRKKHQNHQDNRFSERAPLMSNHPDVYTGRQNPSFQENV